MSASSTDKFRKPSNGSRPETAYLTADKTVGASSATVNTTTGWATDTGTDFVLFRKDTSGNEIAGTRTTWTATVSGTTLNSLVLQAGTEPVGGYPAGEQSVVINTPTAAMQEDLVTGILVQHNQDGTHGAITSTNAVLTTPKVITSLNDTNANELFKVTATSSAVNEFTVANAATGNAPNLSSTGGDTNIDLKLTPKGTGRVVLNGAGAPLTALVTTSEGTSSTTYADLATTTDTVTATIGASGAALITITSGATSNSSGASSYTSFAASGANTIAASDARALKSGALTGLPEGQFSFSYVATGLTAGSTVFKMKYRVTTGTTTYVNRYISVIPL